MTTPKPTEDDGCTCQVCGKKFKVDFVVPDALWSKIGPKPPGEGGLLCGVCIAGRIEGIGEFGAFLVSPELTKASVAVLAERERQKSVEGWTEDHDDEHDRGEMAEAAACYAMQPAGTGSSFDRHVPMGWPWDPVYFKRKSRREDLVRAGALILAEIERLDRKADCLVKQSPGADGGKG